MKRVTKFPGVSQLLFLTEPCRQWELKHGCVLHEAEDQPHHEWALMDAVRRIWVWATEADLDAERGTEPSPRTKTQSSQL